MNAQKIKRKKYLIAAQFQLKYIAYILLFLYIGAAIAGYTVYYTTWTTLGEKLANVYPTSRLVYIFRSANMTLLFRILLITPLFILIGLVLSHRIAGPVYRIGRYVDSLMEGDYSSDLVLRKRDEFKILALKMTELCHNMRDRDRNKQKITHEIINKLDKENVRAEVIEAIRSDLSSL